MNASYQDRQHVAGFPYSQRISLYSAYSPYSHWLNLINLVGIHFERGTSYQLKDGRIEGWTSEYEGGSDHSLAQSL